MNVSNDHPGNRFICDHTIRCDMIKLDVKSIAVAAYMMGSRAARRWRYLMFGSNGNTVSNVTVPCIVVCRSQDLLND